jgi:hypothetical protein
MPKLSFARAPLNEKEEQQIRSSQEVATLPAIGSCAPR